MGSNPTPSSMTYIIIAGDREPDVIRTEMNLSQIAVIYEPMFDIDNDAHQFSYEEGEHLSVYELSAPENAEPYLVPHRLKMVAFMNWDNDFPDTPYKLWSVDLKKAVLNDD